MTGWHHHDLLIRSGRVVDGTGAPATTAYVNAVAVRRDGKETGERPGRLIRGPQLPAPTR